MTEALFPAADASLTMARIAIGCWLILTSVQWIAAADVFADTGPMPWARLRGTRWIAPLRRRMSTRSLRLWMALQLAVAILLLFATALPLLIACLILLLISHGGILVLAGGYGASGSDKMGMIVLGGTLLIAVGMAAADAALVLAGCLVSGGQVLLCYMVAGLSKLRQPDWRSGAELAGVMASDIWGHPFAAALTRSRAMAFTVSWAIMLGEALFPLAILAPQPWLLAALAAMLGFHIATALIMRLNLFPWAFAAAYPSVLLLAEFVRSWLT